ncbi:hypothetical protein BGZ49_003835 [Haplosporangium sp. Z 27]|nr:hypothetical protein BGZ49_003835 [Haplosporangium sp. Z 27]
MSISEKPSKPLPPSVSDITDSMSVKSSKKKMSLGKRISRFFGGGNSKSNDGSSSPISLKSSASSIHGSEKSAFRSSSTSLAPIDELTPPSPVAHNPLYNHQRSFSTPDQIGKITSNSSPVSSKPENQLLRTARDSGSQDSEGRNHRRYSSTITAMPRASHSRSSPQMVQSTAHNPNNNKSSNRSSTYKNESVYIDHHQQQQQLQQQQAAHQSRRSTLGAGSSPQLRPHPELLQRPPSRDNHRHSSFGAEMVNQGSPSSLSPLAPPTQRRGSTPLPGSEPLIARVDRERASVCFQAPTPKKEPTKEKETNMDPVITNLAHQHRKDFRTNHRLGGTSQPPAHQQQHSPQMYPNSPRMRTNSYERQTRDPNLRRESNASQHYYHIDGTATSSPKLLPLGYPPSPGLYTESQMGRPSTSSQQGQHPYISAGQRMNFNGSQGSLHQYQSPNQSQSHLQGGQSSPSVGPQRTSPKRISSAGYFTLPSQQYPQTDSQYTPPPPVLRESPLPSPNFGAVQGGNLQQIPELSLQQQQKQLDQLHQIRVQQQQQIAIQKQQQVQLQRQLQQQQVGLGLGVVPMQAMPVQMTMGVTPQAINMNMPMVLAPTYMQQAHHHHHHPQSTMAAVYSYPSNVPVAAAGYQ